MPQRGGGPPPPQQFQPPARTSSGSGPTRSSPSRPPPPSQYNVDPSIAQTWSSQSDDYEKVAGMMSHEVQRTWSGEEYGRTPSRGSSPPKQQRRRDGPSQDTLSRPNIVKRATSNQNETIETKPDLRGPSVKRAALNRDNSLVSNRLKAEYMNGTLQETGTFDSEKEVRNLSGNLEQATLDAETVATDLQASPETAVGQRTHEYNRQDCHGTNDTTRSSSFWFQKSFKVRIVLYKINVSLRSVVKEISI